MTHNKKAEIIEIFRELDTETEMLALSMLQMLRAGYEAGKNSTKRKPADNMQPTQTI